MTLFENIKKINENYLNKKIRLIVWITRIKKLSSLFFINVIDSHSSLQVVINNKNIKNIDRLSKGDLLEIYGIIRKKIEKNNIKFVPELELISFKLLNKSSNLPFDIEENKGFVNEDTRFHNRYLDLRKFGVKKKLVIKSEFIHWIRFFLHKKGFLEIETPILSQKSLEGANCFLVLSNFKDRFYTLPQSPQIFKQMLMIGGMNKYYQIAKSFRNEDSRSNRQIEFLQLDLEASFFSSKKIMKLIENLLRKTISKIFGERFLLSFDIITYNYAINKYGSEKIDLRKEKNSNKLNFLWIINYPMFVWDSSEKKYKFFRHPFTNLKDKNTIDKFLRGKAKYEDILTDSFDLICNGEEIISGSTRINNRELQEKILGVVGYEREKKEKEFGYFLRALEFAPPSHGGFGMGIDRILSILLDTKIKELIAFPKNIDGTCPLTKTPNFI